MAILDEISPIWGEIDRAENYLVCCNFGEAASLASAILKQLLESHKRCSNDSEISECVENEWFDMLESAGMVLVQSLKHLKRTPELLKELKLLFDSLTLIPVHVFLTGVCFQLSEGLSTTARGFLEEYVNSWMYTDGQYHPLSGAEASITYAGGSCFPSISVDEYLEVVELYVVKLLATTLKDTDLAISWVEKAAALPVEKRQVLLRQLQSTRSSMTSSSQTSISPRLSEAYKSDFLKDQTPYSGRQKDIVSEHHSHEQNNTAKTEILKLYHNRVPYYGWFSTINVTLGKIQFAIPSGKLLLVSLLLIMCYLTRRKHAQLKRFLAKHALSFRKALLDLWQLAFSYQVNPLAAVQTLPNSTNGNR